MISLTGFRIKRNERHNKTTAQITRAISKQEIIYGDGMDGNTELHFGHTKSVVRMEHPDEAIL